MNARNVWVRLIDGERGSNDVITLSFHFQTNLFRLINIYPILFSHTIAGRWMVSSGFAGWTAHGEYEIFTVCCHNKIADEINLNGYDENYIFLISTLEWVLCPGTEVNLKICVAGCPVCIESNAIRVELLPLCDFIRAEFMCAFWHFSFVRAQ